MYALVEERPGVVSIGYDDSRSAVIITWVKNDNDAFRPMLETQLRLIGEHGAVVLIVNTINATGVLNEANQAWLVDDFFPRLSGCGLAALITVVPHSATAVLVNRRSFRDRNLPFSVIEAATIDEALAIASRFAVEASA